MMMDFHMLGWFFLSSSPPRCPHQKKKEKAKVCCDFKTLHFSFRIKGSTAVEIASGLYWYLKYWCGAHVSWDKTGGIQLDSIPKPGSLPLVKAEGVMIQRPVPWNYYQNVVTSSCEYCNLCFPLHFYQFF